MGKYFILFFFILVSFLFSQEKYSFTPWQIDTSFVIKEKSLEIELSERHIIQPQSLNLYLNNNPIHIDQNFKFDQSENKIKYFVALNPGDSLRITYQVLPVFLKKKYSIFKLDTLKTEDEYSPFFENKVFSLFQ